ncbi:MAG: hypothetical protein ABSE49_12270 [Polyangiaceae bacterium]|jgi:hypothetical protein
MNALIVRKAAALLTVGAAALCWNGIANAQNNVVIPQGAPPAAPAAPPATNNNIVVAPAPAAPAPSPGVAEPQAVEPVPVAPVVAERTVQPENRPNRTLLMTGLILFGATYAGSIGVAAGSPHQGDSNLYVPVVGPWLDLSSRPGCPSTADCGAETGNRVLLVGDGILQTIGALEIIGAFVFPETIPVAHVATDKSGGEVMFSPSKVGNGYGMAAVGLF